jgi:hypothetical protein
VNSQFGHITVSSQLERAVLALLEEGFPAYLRQVEREVSWPYQKLPEPENYQRRNVLDYDSGELVPKVVVVSPGLFTQPELVNDENGWSYYKAIWQIGVGIVMLADTEEKAIDMAEMYGAAARGLMVHNQDLDEPDLNVSQVIWLDENYEDIPTDTQHQQVRSAMLEFGIEVETAIGRWQSPDRTDEGEQLIDEIETVITEVDNTEVDAIPGVITTTTIS